MDYLSQILKCTTKDDIFRLAKLNPITAHEIQQCPTKDALHALIARKRDYDKNNPPDAALIREVSLSLKQAVANGYIRFSPAGCIVFGRKDRLDYFEFEPSDVTIRICTEQDNEPSPDIMKLVKPTLFQTSGKRREVLAHAIYTAVGHNDPPSLQAVLDQQGADPNDAVDTMRDSALCFACSHWFNKCVGLLIEYDADVNHRGNAGTPLFYATRHGNTEVATLLLANGADPNIAGDDSVAEGLTALHNAAGWGDIELIRLLVSKGAEVNASAIDGNGTPIHYAARCGKNLDSTTHAMVVEELTRLGGRDSK